MRNVILSLLLLTASALSQVAVSGHILNGSGQPIPGAFAKFVLVNCGDNMPTVTGVGTVYNTISFNSNPSTGAISGNIYTNDQIVCAGQAVTRWSETNYINGQPQVTSNYYIQTGVPFNLDTATALGTIPPPPTWDNVYLRIDGFSVDGQAANGQVPQFDSGVNRYRPQTVAGFNLHSPGPIGDGTPGTGSFTLLQGEANAANYASLSAACSFSKAVYIPAGTLTPAAQITCPQPTKFRGAGVGVSTLRPTSALAATLFATSGTSGEGWSFTDMTIDMTNVPTIGVFSWAGILRPILTNVRVIYPSGGTGTVISKSTTGEAHVTNLMVSNAGTCVDVNGDSGQEDFWTDVTCESPSSGFGYRMRRTTTTDIGGQYLLRFKVTNPNSATGSTGFELTSTATGTASPFWCINCVSDSQSVAQMHVHNMNGVHSIGSWYRGFGYGVQLDTATEFTSTQDEISGTTCDLQFTGTDTTVHFDGRPRFPGSTANVCVGAATIAGVAIIDPVYSASPPISAADVTKLAAAWPTTTGFLSGGFFTRANNTVGAAMFGLYTDVAGATNPNKWLAITSLGHLSIRNSANNAAILDLDDNGVLTLTNNLQMGAGAVLNYFSLTPSMAGSGTVGTTALPMGGLTMGAVANQTTALTTNATANRGVAFPDKNGVVAMTSDITLSTGTPTVGQAACIKSAGPPVVIGYCSTVVGAGGACTCN